MDVKQAVGNLLNRFAFNQAVNEFFALDVGATAIRVVQLAQKTPTQWQLEKYAVTPIDSQIAISSATADATKLGEAILATIKAANITTKNVAVGIPSNKYFSSIIELPNIPRAELGSTVMYEAENAIPTPLEETKIDWAYLGESLVDPERIEVMISSTLIEYIEKRLDFLEGLGLNIISFEPDAVALTRAVLPRGVLTKHIIIDLGDVSTDIIVTSADNPRLIRTMPYGVQSLVQAAAQGLGVSVGEATQYLFKYGVKKEAMDGRLYQSFKNVLDLMSDEFAKTIKYLTGKYPAFKVDSSLLSGYSATIPGFPELIAEHIDAQANFATPWQNVIVDPEHQQQVAPISSQITTAVGLAERADH